MSTRQFKAPRGNILLVDDTPENLRLLSHALTEKGYKVRSVINGEMALMGVRTAPPDLILKVRVHNCPHCGLVIDRDWNSGINILNRAKRTLGLTESWLRRILGYKSDEVATLNCKFGKPLLYRL